MNFDLDDDERALQAGIRDVCGSESVPDHPRAAGVPGGVDRDSWRALGTAGVFGLRLPEEQGGVGLGATQAVLVFEELGRANVPGPLVATHLAAGLIDGAADGQILVGLVERPATGPAVIENLEALDALVVLDAYGLWSVPPGSLDADAIPEPLDPLTPLHRVADMPQGQSLAGPEDAARWGLEGGALTAALCVGLATAATDAAVAYAKERHQFDRPIGSFQAVKHLCADMLVRAEIARAATYAAGAILDDPSAGHPGRAVASALLLGGEAAYANGKDCIQVHGGMGFTWEGRVHLYLKRATVLRTQFGGAAEQAETVAAAL
jgi:alkylation response protein AidB-like acyl-CoA dehydrogenase